MEAWVEALQWKTNPGMQPGLQCRSEVTLLSRTYCYRLYLLIFALLFEFGRDKLQIYYYLLAADLSP